MDEQEVDILDYEAELREHHNMCALVARSKQVWLLTHARRPDREPDQETLTSIILSGLPSVTDWPCWPANLTVVKQTGGQVLRHLVSPAVVVQHLIDNGHAADLIKCEERGQLVVCGYAAAKVADLLGLDHAPRVAHPSRWNIKTKRDKAYKVLSDAHCTGGVSSSSTGWDMTRDAFEEIWNRASYTHVITLGPEGRRAKAKKAAASLGPNGRRAKNLKAKMTLGTFGRKMVIAKANATLGPEGRKRRAQNAVTTLGPNGCKERTARARETLGPEGIANMHANRIAALKARDPEARRESTRKANETLGSEGRKARTAKALKTLGEEGIKKRAATIVKNMGRKGINERNKKIAAGHAARDPAEKSAVARQAAEKLGSDKCKKRTAKALETMGEAGLKKRGKAILQSLGEEGLRKRNEAIGRGNKLAAEKKLIQKYGSIEAGREAQKQVARERRRQTNRERRQRIRRKKVEALQKQQTDD